MAACASRSPPRTAWIGNDSAPDGQRDLGDEDQHRVARDQHAVELGRGLVVGPMLARREQVVPPPAQPDRLGVQQVDVDRPLGDRRERDHADDDERVAPVEVPEHDPQRERPRRSRRRAAAASRRRMKARQQSASVSTLGSRRGIESAGAVSGRARPVVQVTPAPGQAGCRCRVKRCAQTLRGVGSGGLSETEGERERCRDGGEGGGPRGRADRRGLRPGPRAASGRAGRRRARSFVRQYYHWVPAAGSRRPQPARPLRRRGRALEPGPAPRARRDQGPRLQPGLRAARLAARRTRSSRSSPTTCRSSSTR